MTEADTPELTVYGTAWCPDVARTRRFLDRHEIPYAYKDIDFDPEALAFITEANGGDWIVPTIALSDGTLLFNPSLQELNRLLVRPRRANK